MARAEEVYERLARDARVALRELRESALMHDDPRQVILELKAAEATGKVKGAKAILDALKEDRT